MVTRTCTCTDFLWKKLDTTLPWKRDPGSMRVKGGEKISLFTAYMFVPLEFLSFAFSCLSYVLNVIFKNRKGNSFITRFKK